MTLLYTSDRKRHTHCKLDTLVVKYGITVHPGGWSGHSQSNHDFLYNGKIGPGDVLGACQYPRCVCDTTSERETPGVHRNAYTPTPSAAARSRGMERAGEVILPRDLSYVTLHNNTTVRHRRQNPRGNNTPSKVHQRGIRGAPLETESGNESGLRVTGCSKYRRRGSAAANR